MAGFRVVKRVLITGAGGFIGRYAVPVLLEQGYDVHALARAGSDEHRVTSHLIDLLHPADEIERVVSSIRPSHLLHLAWCTKPGKYWNSVENIEWVEASLRLVRSFVACGGRRVVCAGTCAEYEWTCGCCSESETPIGPVSLYGVSKNALRAMLETFARQANVGFAWGRIFFPYGQGEHPERLVSSLANSLLQEKPVVCRNAGLMRDYIHVEDVAGALVALLSNDVEGPINIGSGHSCSLGEIAHKIAACTKREDLLECRETVGEEYPLVVADTRRLKGQLGFTPAVDLDEGIANTVDWCRKQLEEAR